MNNTFLLDLRYARQYEIYFAYYFGMKCTNVAGDDHGVDLISPDGSVKVDVKAYRPPKFVSHFEGVYIETELNSGKKGWASDENKETTHYLLVQDCEEKIPSFYAYYIITKENLNKAMEENDLKHANGGSSTGVILPYSILRKYCLKTGWGDKYYAERNKKYAQLDKKGVWGAHRTK